MLYPSSITILNLKQIYSLLFGEPLGVFVPSISKSSRLDGVTDYRFSPELVFGMTGEVFFETLKKSGFLKRHRFTAILTKKGRAIDFHVPGFRFGFPRMTFSMNRAYLEIPYSLGDNNDWDDLAEEMNALFIEAR